MAMQNSGGMANIDLSEYIDQEDIDQDVSSEVSNEESAISKEAAEQALEESAEQPEEKAEEQNESEETKQVEDDVKKTEEASSASIKDDSEIDIDGQQVKVADMKTAWVKQREQQADYTRKTQALADQRRDFEKKSDAVREEVNKLFSDPDYLLSTFKRRARATLHEAMVKYGTEYQELLDLRANDIGEYHRRIDNEQRNIERLNAEERAQAEAKERETAEYRRIVEETSKIINDNRDKELSKAGVIPKNSDKSFVDYVQKRFKEAYLVHINTEAGVRVTPEFIASIAKELSEDDGIKARLELLKIKKTEPKKNTATITKTQQVNSTVKPKKNIENKTHENFFERLASSRI